MPTYEIHAPTLHPYTLYPTPHTDPTIVRHSLSTGSYDFDTEYYVKSTADLKRLIDTINGLEGVTATDVSTVLDYVKERYDFDDIEI